MNKIIFITLFPALLFAQYTKEDSLLVYTTFTREFDKNIINSYLESDNTEKVKAALLSISNSSDTTFIPDIIKLDYSKYSDEMCFAIGQLGPCSVSEGFLVNKINSGFISAPLLQALGKIGSDTIFSKIIEQYSLNASQYEGISLSLFNFINRFPDYKQKIIKVLSNELRLNNISIERQADAAFTIYRLNLAEGLKEEIIDELILSLKSQDKSISIQDKIFYLLGCLRSIKHFPADKVLFNQLLHAQTHILRIEAARTLCYFPYNNDTDLGAYLDFFEDNDPNVTRTAAVALKELKLDDGLKDSLKNFLTDKLKSPYLSANTKGELLLSYIKIFNPPLDNTIEGYSSFVNAEYLYQAAAEYKNDNALQLLISKYPHETNANKLNILQLLTDYIENNRNNKDLIEIMLNALNSDFSPLVAVAADGIDSVFILENKANIAATIPKVISNHNSDPEFVESNISVANLAERTDTMLFDDVLSTLSHSKLLPIQKYVSDKTGSKPGISYNKNLFKLIWDNSFKYHSAKIKTNKREIVIKFLPGYAPISVGSFCNLAAKGFFKDIIFHRVVPGFVIQAGDPTKTGWGGPGYSIVTEGNYFSYKKGMMGMASAGKDTEGSQWFITTSYYPHLNGRYSVFGEVTDGMETVYRIDQDDWIESVELIKN